MSTRGDFYTITNEKGTMSVNHYFINHDAMIFNGFGQYLQDYIKALKNSGTTIDRFTITRGLESKHPFLLTHNNSDAAGGFTYIMDFVRQELCCEYHNYGSELKNVFFQGTFFDFSQFPISENIECTTEQFNRPKNMLEHLLCIADNTLSEDMIRSSYSYSLLVHDKEHSVVKAYWTKDIGNGYEKRGISLVGLDENSTDDVYCFMGHDEELITISKEEILSVLNLTAEIAKFNTQNTKKLTEQTLK